MLIDPFDLPSVPLVQLNKLPECTAIYFAIDSQDQILYIGQAVNLLARWKNHHREYQLREIDKNDFVRIAWKVCDEEELNQSELHLIRYFQPLLNWTEVKTPEIVPSEIVFRDFLEIFSRRLIIIGFKPKNHEKPTQIHLKYDWRDCSPKGTAEKIREFIQTHKDINTSFKIRRKPYGRIRSPAELRIGSRGQKALARQNRSYNNHWEMACNGVVSHITPSNYFKELKKKTSFGKLAGIKMRVVTRDCFPDICSQYSYDFSGLTYFANDVVPLFWTNQ
jgi:hypothetical protein